MEVVHAWKSAKNASHRPQIVGQLSQMRHHSSKNAVRALQLTCLLGAVGAGYSAFATFRSSPESRPITVSEVRIAGCGSVNRIAVALMVDDDTALTVAHSLRGATHVTVSAIPAAVIALDHRPDLAVLALTRPYERARIDRPRFGPATVGTAALHRPPERTTDVVIRSLGPINIEEPQDRTTYSRAGVTGSIDSGIIRAGESGSPLVNIDGEVIGMLFATDDAKAQNVYAVAATEMTDLLKRAERSDGEPVDLGSC
jgi:S1-C subfamily serine protease